MKLLKRWLGHFVLWIFGWEKVGERPKPDKYVLIAAPHTSNWDLIFMLAYAYVFDLHISWLGKHSLFKFPFGWFMKFLGGIPIDRRSSNNAVKQVAEIIAKSKQISLAIPPEGTRSHRDYWKSGFYYIAREANVPIVLSFLDYAAKRGGFGPTIMPSDDLRADMDKIRDFYKDIKGKFPENYNRIRLRAEDEEQVQ